MRSKPDRHASASPHADPARIAAWVDGETPDDADSAFRHVAGCPRCLGLYRELIAQRGAWLTGSQTVPVNRDLLNLGLAVGRGSVRGGRLGRRRPSRHIFGWATASLVGATALVGLLLGPPSGGSPGFGDALRGKAELRLAQDSASGLAISIPTTEPREVIRAGTPEPGLSEELEELAAYYNESSMDAKTATALITGYLAVGQLDNAAAYLEEALGMFPNEAGLLLVAGVLEYQRSNLELARVHLQRLVELDPENSIVQFNLGVIYTELGHPNQAKPWLVRSMQKLNGTVLGDRAAALLESGAVLD